MRTQKLNPEVLAAATTLLRSADPDLTPSKLLEALERCQPAAKPPGKMLTLKEFGALVNLSLPTLFRMMKRKDESGNPELPTIMLGQRSRRISAEVAESFLRGTRGGL